MCVWDRHGMSMHMHAHTHTQCICIPPARESGSACGRTTQGLNAFPCACLVTLQSIGSNRLAPIGQLPVNSNLIDWPMKAIRQSAVAGLFEHAMNNWANQAQAIRSDNSSQLNRLNRLSRSGLGNVNQPNRLNRPALAD